MWSPVAPEVLTWLGSSSASSRRRSACATRTTSGKGAPPRRSPPGRVLLEEELAGDPGGVGGQQERAPGQVRQEPRRHAVVVLDEVGLRQALLGPEHLRRVGDGHDAALVPGGGARGGGGGGGGFCGGGGGASRGPPAVPGPDPDVSRTQSAGRLSSRSPTNVGWRIPPSFVHSVKRTSQTSRGSTQWWPRPAGAPAANGEVARASGTSRACTRASVPSSKPSPPLPTETSRPSSERPRGSA